jgi:WD40 repeat protein
MSLMALMAAGITAYGQNSPLCRPKLGGGTMRTVGLAAVVVAVAFSPDGQRIVAGSWDISAKVWEAASKEQVA